MGEDDTFKALKRISFDDMKAMLDSKHCNWLMPPVYKLGKTLVTSSQYYNKELDVHYWRIQTLQENGWTFEEYMFESEKIAILTQVQEFNEEHNIPQELIDRAKLFYPNAKFVHAHVTLE